MTQFKVGDTVYFKDIDSIRKIRSSIFITTEMFLLIEKKMPVTIYAIFPCADINIIHLQQDAYYNWDERWFLPKTKIKLKDLLS